MLCRATQDRQVIVKSSDKTWSTERGNGNILQYSCMDSMKRQKDMKLENESGSEGIQYDTREVHAQSLICILLLATPWTVAHQTPLSMGFFQVRFSR